MIRKTRRSDGHLLVIVLETWSSRAIFLLSSVGVSRCCNMASCLFSACFCTVSDSVEVLALASCSTVYLALFFLGCVSMPSCLHTYTRLLRAVVEPCSSNNWAVSLCHSFALERFISVYLWQVHGRRNRCCCCPRNAKHDVTIISFSLTGMFCTIFHHRLLYR